MIFEVPNISVRMTEEKEDREKENKSLLPTICNRPDLSSSTDADAVISGSNQYVDDTLLPSEIVENHSQHMKQDDLALEGTKNI